ncbi:hypothetical protein DPM33_33805 [Mesorhizobium hawassense]|uniref:Uncharacterized protein n=1 Tax=Mesorhizobium hawassense TaxID=1209954 RepID=A0A330HE75_9HYPH|nr:hypothetical protein DPM33_33805 [Mesorhizobium hawassense]
MDVLHDDAGPLRPATTAIPNAAIFRLTMTMMADWPGVLIQAGELCGIPALCYLCVSGAGALQRPGGCECERRRI